MNGEPDTSGRIDMIARAIHAEAVDRIPPRTLAELRPRAAPPPRRSWRPAPVLGWSLATACAAVLAWVAGFHMLTEPAGAPLPQQQAVAQEPAGATAFDLWEDPLMTFEEDPDLFVWLASDARSLAME